MSHKIQKKKKIENQLEPKKKRLRMKMIFIHIVAVV